MKFTTIANAKRLTGLTYLGNINSSAKMIKNKKVSGQYTYIIYLAPAKTSGYNVCPNSTPECRIGCLNTSGRAGMELRVGKHIIYNCRVNKTKLLFENQNFFMNWMIAEIIHYQHKAIRDNMGFSIRLNGTSDIDWANIIHNGKNIFDTFPHVNFYDYTKNISKFIDKPNNYHLTYSYTGRNWETCKLVLNGGNNVVVVFKKELPETFNGYKVVNGDLTDYRIDDSKGIIIGLKFKHISNKEAENQILNSCFVVK
jgi:hypothetical protein